LAEIWTASEAFERFRGTDWMQEPCKNYPRRDLDFGGCRCQAFAVIGDAAATDPACILSPHHKALRQVATHASGAEAGALTYRIIGAATEPVA
jgi:pyrroloquinoline quinone biosynthesis protein E